MKPRTLGYYFSLQSPWSYLGHAAFMGLASRHGLRPAWKPMNLLALFPESGGLPLAKRHPKRVAYRNIELERWRDVRGVPLNLRPAFWPVDIALADRVVVALAQDGACPDGFVRRAFAALWAEEKNLADADALADLLEAAAHDFPAVLARASTAEIEDIYRANVAEALDAGVFGAPTYVLDGEPFWGQDRLALLDQALTSGRAAITV